MNKQYEGAYIWKCYTCLNLHWIKKVDTKHIHYAKYVGLWVPRARHFLFKLDRRAAVKNSWLFLFIRWWQRHRGLMGDINFQPITRAMTEWMKKRGTTSPRDSEIRREVTKNPHFSINVQIFLCDFVPDLFYLKKLYYSSQNQKYWTKVWAWYMFEPDSLKLDQTQTR